MFKYIYLAACLFFVNASFGCDVEFSESEKAGLVQDLKNAEQNCPKVDAADGMRKTMKIDESTLGKLKKLKEVKGYNADMAEKVAKLKGTRMPIDGVTGDLVKTMTEKKLAKK